jgi:hypothetical protein
VVVVEVDVDVVEVDVDVVEVDVDVVEVGVDVVLVESELGEIADETLSELQPTSAKSNIEKRIRIIVMHKVPVVIIVTFIYSDR